MFVGTMAVQIFKLILTIKPYIPQNCTVINYPYLSFTHLHFTQGRIQEGNGWYTPP